MNDKNAYVLITCDVGKKILVKKQLEELEEVKEVSVTHGVYDLVAKIETKSRDSFREKLRDEVHKISDIRSMLTLVLIDSDSK